MPPERRVLTGASRSAVTGQFLRFAGVGAVATAVQYAVLVLLVELGGVEPLAGSVAGFAASWVVNYALNYRFTFRSARPHREAGARFVVVGIVALAINAAVMATVPAVVHYLVAQVLATAIVLGWTFSSNRLWTFAEPSR